MSTLEKINQMTVVAMDKFSSTTQLAYQSFIDNDINDLEAWEILLEYARIMEKGATLFATLANNAITRIKEEKQNDTIN